MNLSIISFTKTGIQLSVKIAKVMAGAGRLAEFERIETKLFTKCTEYLKGETNPNIQFVEKSVGAWAKEQMEKRNALFFIGACGIAVRAIAPYITDKLHDSPVLVADEKGKYVIPILSGHMGGANELAYFITEKIGAAPVITTATDICEKFAVDMFAKKNGLYIVNKDGIAKISSKVLAGKEITMSVESGHVQKNNYLPEGIHIVSYPPIQKVDIVINSEDREFETEIMLKPKEYVIGMGCRRGKEAENIEAFITRSRKELGISKSRIFALASIDIKSDEQGLLVWSRKENIPFITYTAEELQSVTGNFHESDFVKDKVGVDNVCERAALRACEPSGKLVYEKHAEDGMTIAIAKREWSVRFDEA